MPTSRLPRLAIVGIGQELRGDDAIGLEVVRRLQPAMRARDNVLLIEAGPAPENFTGPLRRFHPDLVVLVDAAQMGSHPGSVLYLDWRDVSGFRGSTHSLPLSAVAEYLEKEIGCEVWLLGIQPADNSFGQRLSAQGSQGVHLAVENLKSWMGA